MIGLPQAADGKAWIERKSHLRSGSRLIQCAEQAQGSGERKMGGRRIAVGLNASSQPSDGFGIRAELYLGHAYKMHPPVGKDIARRETESFEYMAFGLGSATHRILGEYQYRRERRPNCDQALMPARIQQSLGQRGL